MSTSNVVGALLADGLFAYFFFSALYMQRVLDYSPLDDILPATLAVGLGAGIAFNPILLAAMSGVAPTEAGLASGVVNTAFMMGGAVGLAVLASLADHRTEALAGSDGPLAALNSGYHVAFVVGALFPIAGTIAAAFIRASGPVAAGHGDAPEPVQDAA